ncbi:MAG: hypothetical protein QG635_117 [Bacteroidota bacterium]|nr:hypothetical protein [Bacteroidota bacterium]
MRSIINSDIFDRTALLSFDKPNASIDPLTSPVYSVGSPITITGSGFCIDSIQFQETLDTNQTWVPLITKVFTSSGPFTVNGIIPCLQVFDCLAPGADTLIYIRGLMYKGDIIEITETIPVRIAPAPLIVTIDTITVAPSIPSRLFRWTNMIPLIPCDTIVISLSGDINSTFSMLEEAPAIQGTYLLNMPLNMPDSLYVRFCCKGSCMRTDFLLKDYKPKYIDYVVPNPFRPPEEQMEIVYKVPEETNVTIKIYDQNNRIVAVPVKDKARKPSIAYSDSWNGEISSGALAANGIYYISLEFSNGAKEVYPVFVRK